MNAALIKKYLTYTFVVLIMSTFALLAWQRGFDSKIYIESEIDGKVQGVSPLFGQQGNSFQLQVLTADQQLVLIGIDNPAAYQQGQQLKLLVKTERDTGYKLYAIKP